MASALFGLDYTVQWGDFAVRATAPPAFPNFDAQIHVATGRTGGTIISMSSVASFYTIRDDLVMKVRVEPDSWRLADVSKWPGKEQVWLIKHEQGHYDIHALLTRDFYWRIRSMMGVPFTSLAELKEAISDHAAATIDRADELEKLYDGDTGHSRNREDQWEWWCAINRARQLHRNPLEKNADGGLLKIELIPALRAAKLLTW